jgi:PucR C-terminal helix-turn-helix domain
MKDLALRLAALDPDAGAALRVIAHFDQLCTDHAALPVIVRAAAALAGCPARLVDEARHLSIRVDPDGTTRPVTGTPDPAWLLATVPAERGARIWLERPGPAGPVDAVVLERAAAAAAAALRGTRATAPTHADLLVDAGVPEPDRLRAARQLGLASNALARAVAVPGGPPHVEPVPAKQPAPYQTGRAGIGPAVSVLNLPSSWAAARTALRFTAEGDHVDPGPRTVAYEELGGLALLADVVGPATRPVPDVRSLTSAAASAPWALATLVAVAELDSLRAAATRLRLHHSTLQYRLTLLERHLGWTVRDPMGRLRLHVAVALRRLHNNPELAEQGGR